MWENYKNLMKEARTGSNSNVGNILRKEEMVVQCLSTEVSEKPQKVLLNRFIEEKINSSVGCADDDNISSSLLIHALKRPKKPTERCAMSESDFALSPQWLLAKRKLSVPKSLSVLGMRKFVHDCFLPCDMIETMPLVLDTTIQGQI